MNTPWHLDEDLRDRYVSGAASPALAASVETHLLACASCRALLTPAVAAPRHDAIWNEIVDRVDAPKQSLIERLLLRAGIQEGNARLLALTPVLRLSWLAGVAVALTLALFAANSGGRGLVVFLALAPVLPVAGVALAFGNGVNPMYEIAAASPYPPFRLLLLRASAVVAATVLLAVLAATLLPTDTWRAAAWLSRRSP